MKPDRRISLLLKTVLSLALLILLLSRVDFQKVLIHISKIQLIPYSTALLLILAGTAGNTLKWRLLLHNAGIHTPFQTLLRYYYIGCFYSMFLPTTIGGDIVRTALLARESNETARTALSVLAERLFGLHALLGVASVSFLLSHGLYAGKAVEPILIAVVVSFCLLTLLLCVPGLLRSVAKLVRYIAVKTGYRKIKKIGMDMEYAVEDLCSSRKNLLCSAGISVTVQLSLPLQAALISSAMQLHIPWQYFFAITPVSGLLTTLPISLNGIGVREWVAVFLYGSLGIKKESILALSFMGFFLVIVNALIGGITGLLHKDFPCKKTNQ